MNEKDHWGRTRLHWAVLNGDLIEVKQLARIKNSIDLEDLDGLTPLRLAIRNNELAIVVHLVGQGAKINKSDFAEADALLSRYPHVFKRFFQIKQKEQRTAFARQWLIKESLAEKEHLFFATLRCQPSEAIVKQVIFPTPALPRAPLPHVGRGSK
jgi:ankyrin repeat protein